MSTDSQQPAAQTPASRQPASPQQASSTSSLPQRLDSAIAETSSGIGMMIADVVKRSLIGGVTDIETTLQSYVSEQVEQAVDAQMPAFADAAHRVAETTSTRLVTSAVTESEGRTREHVQSAIGEATQRTTEQLRTAVGELEGNVRKTTDALEHNQQETRQRVDDTAENISQLQQKSQHSWKRVKSRLETLHEELNSLQSAVSETGERLSARTQEINQQHSATDHRLAGLDQAMDRLKTAQQQEADTVSDRFAELLRTCQNLQQQNETLAARVAELEKPRGLKAMWEKVRRKKTTSPNEPEEADDIDEA
ncbi:MAG: hypothetical protein KDA89_24090 [Planctomycetaceae bacterium]|nr:hypothetical protein [Planctomycetaceae bacterium]